MIHRALFFWLAVIPGPGEASGASIFGPVLYRQKADSPFYGGVQAGTLYFEDFEDAQLNTPGVSVRNGKVIEGQGVDEDDGVLDNLGVNHVWYANGGTLPEYGNSWTMEINFTPAPEQGYPTYAGLALLGYTTIPQSQAAFLFRAYDGLGNDVTGDVRIDAVHLPAGTSIFSTLGDQFIGIHSDNGISKILVATGRFDHLQYGYAIPEAGVVEFTVLTGFLLLSRRQRTTAIHDRNGAEPT
jgi:hypothetical protein